MYVDDVFCHFKFKNDLNSCVTMLNNMQEFLGFTVEEKVLKD